MFISILIYLLQLLNLGLLFHAVLGYEFRSSKAWTGCTLVMIAAGLIIRCLYWENMSPMLGIFFLDGMIIVLPVILLEGDCMRKLLLSVNYRCIYSALYGVMETLCNLNSMSAERAVVLTQLGLTILLCVLYFCLRRRFMRINSSVERMNRGLLFVLTICLIIFDWELYASTNESEKVLKILVGQSQVLSGIISILFVVGIIFIHYIAEKNKELRYLNQLNQKYLEEQTNQYRKLEEKDLALRSFRHDYKMHMSMLQYYLHKTKYDEAILYLDQLEEIEDKIEYIATGNLIGDAILNQYAELGRSQEIEIDCRGMLPHLESVKETDFCALFANAMCNAYEATTQLSGRKTIIVRITNHSGYLFISINNPITHELSFHEGTLTSNKAKQGLHGFGTKIMKEIAERNAGAVKWYEMDGHVETKISIRYAEK